MWILMTLSVSSTSRCHITDGCLHWLVWAGSGGTAGHPLIVAMGSRSLAAPGCMLKYPCVRYWTQVALWYVCQSVTFRWKALTVFVWMGEKGLQWQCCAEKHCMRTTRSIYHLQTEPNVPTALIYRMMHTGTSTMKGKRFFFHCVCF